MIYLATYGIGVLLVDGGHQGLGHWTEALALVIGCLHALLSLVLAAAASK